MTSNTIDPRQVSYAPSMPLRDPNGRVFFTEEQVYRGIFPEQASFVLDIFSRGIVDELVGSGFLVGTELTDRSLEGFGLILRHQTIPVNVRFTEWSPATLLDAARTYLKLYAKLHRHGLALVDGHRGNISLAPGGGVLWHDFGSIVEDDPTSLQGLREFFEQFYYPLALYKRTGSFDVVRRLGDHLSSEDYQRLSHPVGHRLIDGLGKDLPKRAARKLLRSLTHPYLWHSRSLSEAWRMLGAEVRGIAARYERKARVIERLLHKLDAIQIRLPSSAWSGYHDAAWSRSTEAAEVTPHGARQHAIMSLVQAAQPTRVLDIGANIGIFSHLAYRHTPCVISADYDEAAVSKHCLLLQKRRRPVDIYPILLDVIRVDDSVAARYRSDLVLALALTHHLRLGQGFPFSFIAKQLSRLTGRTLITEFMPNGLGMTKVAPSPLPDDYTLEGLLSALRQYFDDVEVVPYEREADESPRTLVVCRRAEGGRRP